MAWLHGVLQTMMRPVVSWLVEAKSIPSDVENELGIDKKKPIIYLLRTRSVTDQLALAMSAKDLGLPSPLGTVELDKHPHKACLFLNKPQSLFSQKVKGTDVDESFTRMFELHRQNPDLDVQIVPVSIFWGRAPGKSTSGWTEFLADRTSPSWLRKFFIVLFLGRDNFVCYSQAVSSRYMADLPGSDKKIAHKLIRLAGTHFHRRKQNVTGPTLIEKEELYNAIFAADSVKAAIAEKSSTAKSSPEEARREAFKYINEIAADYREGLIRIGDRLLTKIWEKIYDGVEVKHAEKVRELAKNGHEIVYVPCHRSHMDYLLLTYVIYHEGLVTPHIAAGVNLNFWPVGGIFRRGGAFFLRRSFAGNKLYTAVFREYLELLFNKGYPVKYYAEGGRSRTGRLLPPKTGMLAMTLQAMIKGVNRPVSLVPVYIGYEHVMEVGSYQNELKGGSKKKESTWGIFSALRKLKNYGYGFLNFGEPILLSSYLDQKIPNWRDAHGEDPNKKPAWLTPAVNSLANEMMLRINQASAISGMSLCAMCLLSAKKHAMTRDELEHALDDYLSLLTKAPFSELSSQPQIDGKKLLINTLTLNKFDVSTDSFGEVISLSRKNAITLTYYRNNILHLFALPGLIAASVFSNPGIHKQKLLSIVRLLYPLLQRELFIYMSTDQALIYTEQLIVSMQQLDMLVETDDCLSAAEPSASGFYSLWLLNRSLQEALQRYAVVLTLLAQEGEISRGALEKGSQRYAERLSALHGIHSPEFFDKNVLATFISALRENKLLEASDAGLLKYSEQSERLREQIIDLIAPEIAQRLQKISFEQQVKPEPSSMVV